MSASGSCGDPNPNVTWTTTAGSTYVPTTTGGSTGVFLPYTTTGGSSGATITTAGSTWGTSVEAPATCRFCDHKIEIGIIIQSKDGKKNNVCIKCAKEYMGGDKVKEILDLVEPLAAMAELAKD